ncbi:hypothetical protein DRJ16_04630 [Candidatus Woesearchaeota archaeon]|nr:MAG: hypothetical protein DRJ16_04630 [Candidatus Woesearchaeota archaeon]
MQNKAHSFVIRIWREGDDENDPQAPWRGYIDYVGKDKRLHFRDIEGITRFIQQELELPPTEKSGWWQKILVHVSDYFNLKD